MEDWEFLLQKEGDRSWLPLESPDVEILEGRYRVVARSSQVRTPVEIAISHEATAEVPPKRRTQKRTGQTNKDGLVVVIPFTRLQPGIWELRCASDLMSDMMGKGWQYAVQLQVLPQEFEASEDWETNWEASTTGSDRPRLTPPEPALAASPALPESPIAASERTPASTQVSASTAAEVPAAATLQPTGSQHQGDTPVDGPADTPVDISADIPANRLTDAPVDTPVDTPVGTPVDVTADAPVDPLVEAAIPFDGVDAVDASRAANMSHADEIAHAVSAADVSHAADTADTADMADTADPGVIEAEAEVAQPAMQPDAQPLPDLATLRGANSLLQLAEQMTDQVLKGIFDEFEPSDSESGSESDGSGVAAPLGAIDRAAMQLQVLLDRDTFVARRGQLLSVSGRVERQADSPPGSEQAVAELRIRLQDPQTNQVLADVYQPLTQTGGGGFICPVAIPADCQTHLMLGMIAVYGALDAAAEPPLLAAQTFTVTTDLDELLEAIANDFTESDEVVPPIEFASSGTQAQPASLDVSLLNLLAAAQPAPQFQPSSQTPLPPQIYRPAADKAKPQPLDLPFYKRSAAIAPPADPENLFPPAQPEGETPLAATVAFEVPPPSLEADPNPSDQPLEASVTSLNPPVMDAALTPGLHPPLVELGLLKQPPPASDQHPLSPTDAAFRALNLQARFLSRLSSLAGDVAFAQFLQEGEAQDATVALPNPISPIDTTVEQVFFEVSEPPFEVSDPPLETPSLHPQAGDPNSPNALLIGMDADLAAQEIVVEDEAVAPRLAANQPLLDPPEALVLPKDEPVPAPQLQLPGGDLISGKPINLVTKLPNLAPRIYVKFWVRDRQTRSILDGPRWLVNFIPDGLGSLESHTQLTVPYGCMEIQVEAIAVEMTTQRESHKVILDRVVLPPDLPDLSFDGLDDLGL